MAHGVVVTGRIRPKRALPGMVISGRARRHVRGHSPGPR